MNQKYLQIVGMVFSVLFFTACAPVISALPPNSPTPQPTTTFTITPTVTLKPTWTPRPFITTNNPKSSSITTVTFKDIQTGRLAAFEHTVVDRQGPITNYKVDYDAGYLNSVGITQLGTHKYNEERPHSELIKAVQFFSVYKISLDLWGFVGKEGNIASYVYEDAAKNKAIFHFLLTRDYAIEISKEGVFTTDYAKIVPFDKLAPSWVDNSFITGKPQGEGDFRSINNNIYSVQGYEPSDITALFERIAQTDIFSSEDITMIESVIFIGVTSPSNHD